MPRKVGHARTKNGWAAHGRTSLRLEDEFWALLERIAKIEGCDPGQVTVYISTHKPAHLSFSAAIRVFVALYFSEALKGETAARIPALRKVKIPPYKSRRSRL